jgi:hypothetical protein
MRMNQSSLDKIDTVLKIENYLAEAVESSKRVRKIVFLLMFTSVIAFMSYWNSRGDSWVSKRYSAISEAYRLYAQPDSNRNENLRVELSSEKEFADTSTKKFLELGGLDSKTKIEDLKRIFINLNEETYRVRVPILGISFDINDLGLFTGITFTFLLLLCWFAIEREKDNIEVSFRIAKEKNVSKEVYEYLSMSQVITLPRHFSNGTEELGRFWKILPKTLIFAPALVQFLIMINDLSTFEIGIALNKYTYTISLVAIDIIFCLIITGLTILYVIRSSKIDQFWNKEFDEIIGKDQVVVDHPPTTKEVE